MASESKKGQQMWGGRFAAQPSDIMQSINASIDVDRRMVREDIAGSRAHADMLAEQGIISEADNVAIQDGLDQVVEALELTAIVEVGFREDFDTRAPVAPDGRDR